MRFKEWLLAEIFNNPNQVNWSKQTNTDWEGSFDVGNKRYLIRMIRDINMPWEVSFDLVQGNTTTQDITGTGNAASVFSTVLGGINQWMKATNPESFAISARENSRQSLYRRMLKMLPKNWEVDDLGSTFFVTNTAIAQPAFSGYRDDDFSDYWNHDAY